MNVSRQLFWALLLLPITMPVAPAHAQQPSAAGQLQKLLEEVWEFDLTEDPLFATRVGDHRFNDRLSKDLPEDFVRRSERKKEFLDRLRGIDRTQLEHDEQINFDIFQQVLENDLEEARFRTYLMPISNRWGFHIAFPELPKQVPLENVRDYENYIARLRDFARHADEQMQLLQAGAEAGLVLPAVVLDGYQESIEPHIVEDPTRSLLYAPFADFPEVIDAAERERLAKAGRAAIAESVVPSYRRFLEFMRTVYLPATRGSIAASALPDGRDFYRYRVRMFTTLDLTPEQVHETGLAEVKRIRQEMEQVIERTDFEGEFEEFLEHLRTEPRFYADTPEQLLKEVSFILKRMDGQLPELFGTLPRMPYGIREIPSFIAPKTTSAYYMQPAGDGSYAGFFYVNTYDLKSRPLYEMEALSLHEAVPGHHLQIALQQELTGLPEFRRFTGFTAFIEGWALYAERLGLEVGFYEDPYSDFGRLTFEMWRACRLVVDTGIHYLGWSRKQAIDFMAANTALSLHNIEAEVDRYISWPGQALAYKIGELKIRQLRDRAKQQLADRFDVRQFHDVVLGSGAVPLLVLEQNVERYIEERQQAEGKRQE